MIKFWLLYAILGMNAWIWSTVFHTRDVRWTEVMDYLSAVTFVVLSTPVGIIRTLNLRTLPTQALAFLPSVIFLLQHYYYMLYIKFDYGWNTLSSILAGAIGTCFWIYWIVKHKRKYSWRIIFTQVSLWLFASLEIFDFSPFYDLMDAHAIWHGSTIHLAFIWYHFVLQDIEYEDRLQDKLL